MDPRLVLQIVSIPNNKPVLVRMREEIMKIVRCQDMIFLNLYFNQFYACSMDIPPSLHRHFPYDSYDFTTYDQEQVYCCRC